MSRLPQLQIVANNVPDDIIVESVFLENPAWRVGSIEVHHTIKQQLLQFEYLCDNSNYMPYPLTLMQVC